MDRSLALAAMLALGAAAPLHAQAADSLDLSLGAAVERALAGDEVALAEGRRDAASAAVGGARAGGLPQLRFSGTFNHVYENARAQAVGQIFNQPNTYTTNATLSVPLFQGGRVANGTRAAVRLRDAAGADLAATQADVRVLVLRAYLAAQLADRLVAIQDTNLALAEARLRQVEQFERGGRAARYDVLRARVELSNLQPTAIAARGQRELALVELRRLANLPEDRPLRLSTRLDPDAVRALADAAEAGAGDTTTLAALPEVQAARFRALASRAAVRVARAQSLPTVSLNLVSGYQAYPPSMSFPLRGGALERVDCPEGSPADRVCTQQNGGWFSDRSLQLAVNWPVFDGLRTRADVQQARVGQFVAELQARQALETARLEETRARTELASARAVFEAGRQTAAEAEEAYRLAALRFARGLGTQLDVSDAQLALLTARTNEARAVYDLYLAAAELARALGRPVPLPAGA